MDDLRGQVEGLRRRLRLQSVMSVGVLVILMFAMGGADTVARTLVDIDAWRVRTRKADLSYVDRLVATTDVNRAKLKVLNGNIQLEGELNLPNLTQAEEGTLGFDSTAKKLKYWNGSGWVESGGGGGIGGAVFENDAFRLEQNSPSTLRLIGTGRNGGTINIDGTLYGFASTAVSNAASGANIMWYAYAYIAGSAVNLEISTTPPTVNQYGVYATKGPVGTPDVSRRYVGMGYYTNLYGGAASFYGDLVRSVKNERGYGYLYKHAPSTGIYPSTTNTTWTDIDPVLSRTGLFFDGDRIRAWASMMPHHSGQWVGRVGRLGVSVNGSPTDDSEVSCAINTGGYWAAAMVPFRSEAYITISGAGPKYIRPVHRSGDGSTSVWYVQTNYPASVGFEVLR